MNYYDRPEMSNSKLGWISESPKAYKYYTANGCPISDVMKLGQQFHSYLLEFDDFQKRYYVFDPKQRPDKDKNMNGNENKAWRAEICKGKEEVSLDDKLKFERSANDLYEDIETREILEKGEKEKEFLWTDEETGIDMKMKVDIDYGNGFYDVKYVANIDLEPFERKVFDMHWYRQAAVYLDGSKKKHFYNIGCSKKSVPDHLIFPYSNEYVKYGRDEYKRLLRIYKECKEKDLWPGIVFKTDITGQHSLELPNYAMYRNQY